MLGTHWKEKSTSRHKKSMWPLGQWVYYESPMSTNSKQSLCILIFPYSYINKNVSGQVIEVWKPVSV